MKEYIQKNAKILSIVVGCVVVAAIIIGVVVYKNNHLTVTYMLDGEEYEVAENIKKGQTIDEPQSPTKEGYAFDGWYLDDEKFDFDTEIKGKLVLEARFTINKYTVTFANAFALPNEVEVEWNKKVSKPENPYAYGYLFTGWYVDGVLFDFDTAVKDNITLTAGWMHDSVNYTVNHFIVNDEGKYDEKPNETKTEVGYVGATVTPDINTYKGYKKPEKKSIVLGYNTNTVNYYYDLESYKLAVVGDEGVASTSGTGVYNYKNEVEIGYKLKPGYEFVSITPELTDSIYVMDDSDVEFTITTKATEYKINLLNVEGATFTKTNPTTYTVKDEKITLVNPSKLGYTFKGWAKNETATTGEMTVTVDPSELVDVTYYATWELNSYTITYNLDGGVVALENPTTYNILTNTFKLNNPTKAGKHFAGWKVNTSDTAELEYIIEKGTVGDITFTAVWSDYMITLNEYGENVSYVFANENGEWSAITLVEPTRKGYNFAGWYTDNSLADEYLWTKPETGVIDSDLVLYAKWTPIEYTITYDLDGGEMPTTVAANPTTYTIESTPFDITSAPSKEGKHFAGWIKEETDKPVLTYHVEEGSIGNITLKAVWADYMITLNENNGKVSYVFANESDEWSTIAIVEPTKKGYTFIDWYTDENFGVAFVKPEEGVIEGDYVLYANYQKDTYSITYDLDGGLLGENVTNPSEYQVDTNTFTLNNPTKEGYRFMGWNDGTNTKLVYTVTTGTTGNITLKAMWAKEYTVTLVDGDTVLATFTVINGDDWNLGNPTKPASSFDGWYVDEDLTIEFDQEEVDLDDDITIYAKFTELV